MTLTGRPIHHMGSSGKRRKNAGNEGRPSLSVSPQGPFRRLSGPRGHSIDRAFCDCGGRGANCRHGVRRGRRLFRRAARAGGRRCSFHRARFASCRHARARPRDRRRAGSGPSAQCQRDRRPENHRPGRDGDVLRQAVGHRSCRAPTAAAYAAGHRGHLVSKRCAERRHAAADPRRQRAHGRRRICRDQHRPAGGHRPDRLAATIGVRRV